MPPSGLCVPHPRCGPGRQWKRLLAKGTGLRLCLLFTRVLLGGFHLLPEVLLWASSPLCLTHNSAMRSEDIPEPPPCTRALCGGRLQDCAWSLGKEFYYPRSVPHSALVPRGGSHSLFLPGTSARVCVCVPVRGGGVSRITASQLTTEDNEAGEPALLGHLCSWTLDKRDWLCVSDSGHPWLQK